MDDTIITIDSIKEKMREQYKERKEYEAALEVVKKYDEKYQRGMVSGAYCMAQELMDELHGQIEQENAVD